MRRDELLGEDLPADIAEKLRDLDAVLVALMVRLATAVWDRKDADAVDAITICLVDLPTAIVLGRNRIGNHTARRYLHAAVRAVLTAGPADNTTSKATGGSV